MITWPLTPTLSDIIIRPINNSVIRNRWCQKAMGLFCTFVSQRPILHPTSRKAQLKMLQNCGDEIADHCYVSSSGRCSSLSLACRLGFGQALNRTYFQTESGSSIVLSRNALLIWCNAISVKVGLNCHTHKVIIYLCGLIQVSQEFVIWMWIMYFENPDRMLECYNFDSLSLSAHSYSRGGGVLLESDGATLQSILLMVFHFQTYI